MNCLQKVLRQALLVATVLSFAPAAHATVLLMDTYVGGNDHGYGDSIGNGVFNITSAAISRTNANTLHVVINTAYAGAPGTPAAEGTGYGALFITPGANAWHPVGAAPYLNDVYVAGQWQYAFVLPQVPSSSSGSGNLYSTADGSVVLANVGGNPVSWPNPGNSGWIFRDGQAVQFTPNQNAAPVASGLWSVGPNTITMDIFDNGLLGSDFALSWAMTCGNDVIQGQVSGVPEPSTWAMMFLGFAGVGSMGYRRARKDRGLARAA